MHRFNAAGLAGLVERPPLGAARRLTLAQEVELAALVAAGPDVEIDGVVRWRCVDLKALIGHRWGVIYHERSIGKLLVRPGFRHIITRPRHHDQNSEAIETFKKRRSRSGWRRS